MVETLIASAVTGLVTAAFSVAAMVLILKSQMEDLRQAVKTLDERLFVHIEKG